MKKVKLNNYSLWIIIFLSFLGFYVTLLVGIVSGYSEVTRVLSIPIRVVIMTASIYLLFKNYKNKVSVNAWFVVFVLIYAVRIFIDYSTNQFLYSVSKKTLNYLIISQILLISFLNLLA